MDDLTSDSPTTRSALSDLGGVLAGRYRVRARLGRGATKEVYLAYDERLDREVALALVVGAGSEVSRARVRREAQVTGRLGDHPNVITVYDIGEVDGLPYLVLRAMRGGSLADLLDRQRPSFAEATRLGGEIASALAHAHDHGVIHRDVKPDNVWLTADGRAALGDFGIAHQPGLDRLTAEGVVVGTVRYLSPEQIRGDDSGPAGDLYALGVTLYEVVTGRPPFTAPDASQILAQHLTVAPAAPSQHEPGVPPALERLILRLLAKHPSRRPASAHEVVDALAAIVAPADDSRGTPLSAARARIDLAHRATVAPVGTPGHTPGAPVCHDTRRVVSVLAVGADVEDPEALHGILDRCATAIEDRGGTVERYLGDALVGIFGLADSQGDEALQAARAAVDLRTSSAQLRLGIETGEVFLGSGPRGVAIVTGAPITAAVRLAEHAPRGEIVLGSGTRRAVDADATFDDTTGRLIELRAEQPALLRPPATTFVGRSRELDALLALFARVRDERSCRLVTVAGAPGIGKSRLAGELLAALGDQATVLAGHCIAYGEGTAYLAITEIVRAIDGDTRTRIEQLLGGDEQAIRGILGAIGLSDEAAQAEETAWALRTLLARLALERPLVVAVEDIHWAEPALLDLLDQLVVFCGESPILVVCLTRPELLERRPAWGVDRDARSLLVLGPLADDEATELAERLGATQRAAPIARRAEGNPLFVEQLVAIDAGREDGELPASIQAVLSARIDRLEEDERIVLRHAAVEGRTFHVGPLERALTSRRRDAVGACLVALAGKGLIGEDRPQFVGECAHRFAHALIRDAAYASVPKAIRSRLHADVADWLDERPDAADEVVGHHLEQACRLAAELGPVGVRERRLATRAAGHLRSASQGALARADADAASALLERSIALLDDDDGDGAREELQTLLGAALFEAQRTSEATRVLDDVIAAAREPSTRARARVERELVRLETDASAGVRHSSLVADEALPVLERAGDHRGLCRLWALRGQLAWTEGRIGRSDDAFVEAARHARRAGDERERFEMLGWRATAAMLGPMPVDEAIAHCEQLRVVVGASPVAVAWIVNPLAALHAMRGELELAETYLREADETLGKLGGLGASVSHHAAYVRLLAGRPDQAEIPLRSGVERLTAMGESRALATTTAMLAQAVYAQGRSAEAAQLCQSTAATAAADDIVTQAIWRGVRARLLADDGRFADGARCAREAVALVAGTDLLSHHGDALIELAEVLHTGSDPAGARTAAQAAGALYAAKRHAPGLTRARRLGTRA